MALIEYTKSKDGFLLTGYKGSDGNKVTFRFSGAECKTLRIGDSSFEAENAQFEVNPHSLKEGVHTPIAYTEEGCLLCDKIKVRAGVIIPLICDAQKALYLTKRIIAAEEELLDFKKKLCELSEAVYGKSIL